MSEIKKLKIFISQKNFFNKKKLTIKRILIDGANFSMQQSDFKFYNQIVNSKFPKKTIDIRESNLFFKDNNNETIFIIKLPKLNLHYDNKKLLNLLDAKAAVFNMPFNLYLSNPTSKEKNNKIIINSKKLKLEFINNMYEETNKTFTGLNTFAMLNSKFVTKYKYKNSLIEFNSIDSKLNNTKINYKGKLLLKPFDFDLKADLERVKLSNLINQNSIFFEFFKNRLLFSENISSKVYLDTPIDGNGIFNHAKINFQINNEKINFNQTKLLNKKIGLINIDNSDLYFKNDDLMFSSDLNIKIKNLDNFFSFFQTSKKIRKTIKNININFDYNFFKDQVNLNSFKIDNVDNNLELQNIIDDFNKTKNDSLKNMIKSKAFMNKLLEAYFG